jgi:hypothetical protein
MENIQRTKEKENLRLKNRENFQNRGITTKEE